MKYQLDWEEREDRFERKYTRAIISRPDRVIHIFKAERRPGMLTLNLTPTNPNLRKSGRNQINQRWIKSVGADAVDAAIDELLALRLTPPPKKSRRTGWQR